MTATTVPVSVIGRGSDRLNVTDIALTNGNASDGMDIVNDGSTMVWIENTDDDTAAYADFTVASTAREGLAANTKRVTGYAFGKAYIEGPFPTEEYGTTLHILPQVATLKFKAFRFARS